MTRRRSERCLSDLALDRWLAGELTPAEGRLAEEHVSSCEGCRSQRAELIAGRQGFLHAAPPFAALERGRALVAGTSRRPAAPVARRLPPSFPAKWGAGRWLAGAALAAAAVVALAIGQPWRASEPPSGATRTKGSIASLGWVVRRGDHVFAGGPAETLRAGDAVRFTLNARESVYVAIFGFDGVTEPRVYFPEAERLAKVEAGRERVLAMAIELDATPQDESGYAVYCRSAEPVASVRAALARSADEPRLPPGCSGEPWFLRKERP